MKKKIKIKDYGLLIETHGNWYDLKVKDSVQFEAPHLGEEGRIIFDQKLINLNLSIELPKWYELELLSRSSTFKRFGIIKACSKGIIDGPDNDNDGYIGDNDVVKFNALAFKSCYIPRGERIAQFKIVLNQKAPWWVKVRDLFYSGFEFDVVNILHNKDRGGHGTSNK